MSKEISSKKILKNVSLSITAQLVSLFVAFILNLIVPKYISEYDYAYWQTYVLYASYVGILHFGILDGIVLRYSQYDYEELDHKMFRSQFFVLFVVDSFCSIAIILGAFIVLHGSYLTVAILVAVAVISKNIIKYSTYCLQITNRIKEYALVSIIQKAIYGVFVIIILLLHGRDFYLICIGELLGEFLAFAWSFKYNRAIYVGKRFPLKDTLDETKKNISVGVFLLISNWSAMLTIGITKMIVQWHWDELVFGKVAFSFSVTSLFLTFVQAISVVLFPTLKRIDEGKLPELYVKIRDLMSPFLVSLLIFYYPGTWILSKWLPKYNESVLYLGILLPIIIYRTRVSLLTNNYLKAYRKEKTLLYINLGSVSVSIFGGLIIAYIFNNIDMLLAFTVITFMGMSIVAEYAVGKVINKHFVKENIAECIMTITFFVCTRYLSPGLGVTIYFVLLSVYLYINRDVVKQSIKRVMR